MKTQAEVEGRLLMLLHIMADKIRQNESGSDIVIGISIGLLWTFDADIFPPEAAGLNKKMKEMMAAVDACYARLIASKQ